MKYRSLPVALFLIVLVIPFALRSAARVSTKNPAPSAAHITVISPHAEAIRTEFADAFSAWHQRHYGSSVFVDYRIYGGASDIVRYFESAKRTLFASLGTYKIDIVWGGGDYFFDHDLAAGNYLRGVQLDSQFLAQAFAQPQINGLSLYDVKNSPPQWFGTALSSFGIVYNRDVLRHLNLPEPKTWKDLADPKYAGWILLADPNRSGAARTAFMIIIERAMQDAVDAGQSADLGWARGMGLIRQIAANARMFTDNGTIVPGIISNGEAAAGMAIDFQARSQVDAVQVGNDSRLGYIEPAGATAINPDPVAMVRGAENPEIAKHFIEFLLSEPGQRLWNTRAGVPGGPKHTSLRRLPIMRSVYDSPTNFTDAVNPYVSSGTFNTRRDRTLTAAIISQLIQASCVDTLDELRQTQSAILASPHAKELDEKLGVFPFDQQEALKRLKQIATSTPLEVIDLQRHWTEDFRHEYADLRKEAAK